MYVDLLNGTLNEYGSDEACIDTIGLICFKIDRGGPHERALCAKIGALDCATLKYAVEKADYYADLYFGGKGSRDPRWNAMHHALWMAFLAAGGFSPEAARMFGYAHELDSSQREKAPAPALGSRDSRRDLANNEAGIAVGMAMRRMAMRNGDPPNPDDIINEVYKMVQTSTGCGAYTCVTLNE